MHDPIPNLQRLHSGWQRSVHVRGRRRQLARSFDKLRESSRLADWFVSRLCRVLNEPLGDQTWEGSSVRAHSPALVVGPIGLELATNQLRADCSNQQNYRHTLRVDAASVYKIRSSRTLNQTNSRKKRQLVVFQARNRQGMIGC